MTATDFGRIPLTIVEIDQQQCTLDYGVGACGAVVGVTGTRKCYNTLATCQFKSAYVETPITLRFAKSHADIPIDNYIIPSLRAIKTSPTRINIGGRKNRDAPLGRRAEISVTFKDHPHSDIIVDKYVDERTHDPFSTGTFWAKWLKRNPYYNNWAIRIKEGYVGESLTEMNTRHYIIEKINGPDSKGNVTIKGFDILRRADGDKAKAPELSPGKLFSGISAGAATLTVTSASLTDYTGYSANVLRINEEVIRYTAVTENSEGNLVFTGLTRGTDGTEAQTHDADDTVQACIEYVNAEPWAVVQDLFINSSGIDPSYINYTDWTTEATTWLGGMTVSRLLTEPEGVDKLVGELCEQCSMFVWWDEIDQEIKLRTIHPAIGEIPLITEDLSLLQNEASIKERPELRASEVWVSFHPRNQILDLSKRESYRQTIARIAAENPYSERRVYEVMSPWLDIEAQVDLLTFRILARYRNPPKYLSFALDPKDRHLRVGDPFDIEYRGFVDDLGEIEPQRYQVISAHESPPGEKIIYEAQKFDYAIDFKAAFWMIDAAPIYSLASETEKTTGGFWANDDGRMNNGDQGYVWS